MRLQSVLPASALVATLLLLPDVSAVAANDPRIAINAVNTPGTANSVYRIENPGSYYLEENLVGQPGKHGILIEASNVRIDLMGFLLIGVSGSDHAITSPPAMKRSNITIHGGGLESWPLVGIALSGSALSAVRDVTILSSGTRAIDVASNSAVERCRIQIGLQSGIRVGKGSLVADCVVQDMIGLGIDAAESCVIRNCTVTELGSPAVRAERGSIIRSCTVSESIFNGIFGNDITVVDSTVTANGGPGIVLRGGIARGCSVSGNEGAGIALEGGTARDCDVFENAGHGIWVHAGDGHVEGNRVKANGQDGIRAEAGTRVEANAVRGHKNGYGIRVTGTGSFVVKNTLFGNQSTMSVTNSGNFAGPLVHVNSAFGRDDPWANLYGN